MKKSILWLLIAVLAISMMTTFSLSGCKTKSAETTTAAAETTTAAAETTTVAAETTTGKSVTIRFMNTWATGEGNVENLAMLEEWAKQYPNLKLVQEVIVGDESRNKIRADAAADNLPDIFFFGGTPTSRDMIEAGMLLKSDEYLKVSKTVKKEDIPQFAWDVYSLNGTAYGVPTQKYNGFFSYNKAIFDKYNLKPPKTYEEMVEVAKVLNANGIIPLNVGSKGGNPSHFWYTEMFNQLPGGLAEVKGFKESWNFNTANELNTTKIILQQRQDGMYPKDTVASGDWDPSIALYNEEKAAMCYSYSWMVEAMKPEIIANSVLIDVPKMPGGVVDPSTIVMGGASYGFQISAKSWADPEKQPYILALADWIVSDEMQAKFVLNGTGGITVKKGVMETIDRSSLTPNQEWFLKVLDNAETRENVPCHWDVWPSVDSVNYFQSELDVLWAGGDTAEQFVQKVQKSLDDAKAALK